MNDVLLLKTNWPASFGTSVPLGLLYLSSYLKQKGYSTIVRDMSYQNFDWNDIKNSKYIGISMLSFCRNSSYQLIREIKSKYPEKKIILGGNHTSSLYKNLADNLPIDAVVVGEGEVTMYELIKAFEMGGDVSKVKGAYVSGGNYVKREQIQDLDKLPFPDYGAINMGAYRPPIVYAQPNYVHNGIRLGDTKFSNMITSRGCVGCCKFCDIWRHWTGGPRFRSAQNIFDEMLMLNNEYGINFFNFNDDSFALDRDIAMDLLDKIIDEGLKIVWYSAIRPDCVDSEILELMRESGCLWLAFGIESCSDAILKNIGKGTTKQTIIDAVALTKNAGIKTYALLMCGNLGETDSTINETAECLNQVGIDLVSFIDHVWAYPGTYYCKKMNIPDAFWINGADGIPTFYDGFTNKDLYRWAKKLKSIRRQWL